MACPACVGKAWVVSSEAKEKIKFSLRESADMLWCSLMVAYSGGSGGSGVTSLTRAPRVPQQKPAFSPVSSSMPQYLHSRRLLPYVPPQVRVGVEMGPISHKCASKASPDADPLEWLCIGLPRLSLFSPDGWLESMLMVLVEGDDCAKHGLASLSRALPSTFYLCRDCSVFRRASSLAALLILAPCSCSP